LTDKLATDQVIVTDCLNRQKSLSDSYNRATLESTNSALRNTFSQIHREEVQAAERLFREMSSRGWYKPEMATPQEISEAQQSLRIQRTR